MRKSADVPGLTLSRTCLMKLSSMPKSVSAPLTGPPRRSNRKTQQRDEEDQADEETPEGAANSACSRCAKHLSCLRPFAALRPSDHSRVHQFDQLLLLQPLQNPERLVSAVIAVEFQY